MKDYASMSDQQINVLVIEAMVKSGIFTDEHDDISGRGYVSDGWCWGPGVKTNLVKDGKPFVTHHNGRKLDYCNNPADAWPIIEQNKISLTYHHSRGHWSAIFNHENISMHGSPLRAAMIVFLMMKESENA